MASDAPSAFSSELGGALAEITGRLNRLQVLHDAAISALYNNALDKYLELEDYNNRISAELVRLAPTSQLIAPARVVSQLPPIVEAPASPLPQDVQTVSLVLPNQMNTIVEPAGIEEDTQATEGWGCTQSRQWGCTESQELTTSVVGQGPALEEETAMLRGAADASPEMRDSVGLGSQLRPISVSALHSRDVSVLGTASNRSGGSVWLANEGSQAMRITEGAAPPINTLTEGTALSDDSPATVVGQVCLENGLGTRSGSTLTVPAHHAKTGHTRAGHTHFHLGSLKGVWADESAFQEEALKDLRERCSFNIKAVTPQERIVTKGLLAFGPQRTLQFGKFNKQASCGSSSSQDTTHGAVKSISTKAIFHPIGLPRLVWNCISMCLIVWDIFIIPMQAFQIDHQTGLMVVEWVATLIWTFDVAFTLRTGYIIGSTLEMRPKHIAIHYAKTWLFVDLVIVTLEWVSRFAGIIGSASLLRSSRVLRTIRLVKLVRLAKMNTLWHVVKDQVNSNVADLCLTMLVLFVMLVTSIHILCCTWYALGDGTRDGWVTYDAYTGEKNIYFWYISSARWVISQLNGRTDMDERRNMVERFFTCVVGVTLAVLAQAVFTSFITKTMLDLSELVSEKTRRRRLVNQYMDNHSVPPILISCVKRYVSEYQDSVKDKENEKAILAILPAHVKAELLFEVRSPVLVAHPLFTTLNEESVWAMHSICCDVVEMVTAVKYDIVFDKGQTCTRILFLDKVTAKYGEPSSPLAHLELPDNNSSASVANKLKGSLLRGTTRDTSHIDTQNSLDDIGADMTLQAGTWISELALWMDWRNQGRMVSETHGHMYAVEADDLANALKKHPEALLLVMIYVRALAEAMKSQKKPRDVLFLEVDYQFQRQSILGAWRSQY